MHDCSTKQGPTRRKPALAPVFLAAGLLTAPATAEPVRTRFVEAELVSDVKTIRPGSPFQVALRLAMDPDWHTYWENPGDTGLPTTLRWELPEGFTAAELRFPYPHRFVSSSYVSYGYEGEVLILQEITPPAQIEPGASVHLAGRADWTVCREDLCMPGGADLALELDVGAADARPDGYWKNRFAAVADRLPVAAQNWSVAARADGSRLILTLTRNAAVAHDPGAVEVFERRPGTIDRAEPPRLVRSGDALEISLALSQRKQPTRIDAVLVAANGWEPAGSPRAILISASLAVR